MSTVFPGVSERKSKHMHAVLQYSMRVGIVPEREMRVFHMSNHGNVTDTSMSPFAQRRSVRSNVFSHSFLSPRPTGYDPV